MLNKQRGILNELEESLNEKKKTFKHEIMLSDEMNHLKMIERNVEDPSGITLEVIEKVGID